jgi:ABC-type amino acid transport system permease subunit
MMPRTGHLLAEFLPNFLAGMSVNFGIAAIALGIGLAFGALFVIARLRGGWISWAAAVVVGLMRAAPTFVIMFFLLHAVPQGGGLPGSLIVAFALVPYATAYVSDNGSKAVDQWRAGSALAGLLILPNIARAFFVLVMSSSVGAAIGVHEGIAVLLQEAEHLHAFGDRLILFAIAVGCFGIPLLATLAATRFMQNHLGNRALRPRR